jgi:hypothetical protein
MGLASLKCHDAGTLCVPSGLFVFCPANRAFGRNPMAVQGGSAYSSIIAGQTATPLNLKENIMNIAKNMEAIFVAIIAIAAATSLATAAVPKFRAAPAASVTFVASADQATMHTVYVSAKRLSAEEKAAL